MSWMFLARQWIIVLVIFCLLGTISQACHDYEEDQKCYEDKNEENIDEEKVETSYGSDSGITSSKWFLILNKLIDRYPIIERIIERIFQWIINNLLDMDY
jgi:hypothetical protein